MSADDLLIELGCEPLPAGVQSPLIESWEQSMRACLDEEGLSYQSIDRWVTPRRLALCVRGLSALRPLKKIKRLGPFLAQAFDLEKNPTMVGLGFARACGVPITELAVVDSPKGERLLFQGEVAGEQTIVCLPRLIPRSIRGILLKKSMYWEASKQPFVRPVRWLLALYGRDVVDFSLWGLSANRFTYGHADRHPEALRLDDVSVYESTLQAHRVVPDASIRKKRILEGIEAVLLPDQSVLQDARLLQEVVGLVEWPVIYKGQFDPHFLQLPHDVLIAVMKGHQRYFPVWDKNEKQLQACFIIVSHTETDRPQRIIDGNQRVMQARLRDAAFFCAKDSETPLSKRVAWLKRVVWQESLGTLYDKACRMQKLATPLSESLGLDHAVCEKAAWLAKADLTTEMVQEFPVLQGVMGGVYAEQEGEEGALCRAIAEQYRPHDAKDRLPASPEACLLSLMDRLDQLVGFFRVGLVPTGDKDPFALRRAAMGVLRILLEKRWALSCHALLDQVCQVWRVQVDQVESMAAPNSLAPLSKGGFDLALVDRIWLFLKERLTHMYLDQGIQPAVIKSVLACEETHLIALDVRIQALQSCVGGVHLQRIVAIYKRMASLLNKHQPALTSQSWTMQDWCEKAERVLAHHLVSHTSLVARCLAAHDINQALIYLETFAEPLDQWFDKVLVLSDVPKQRQARLALLVEIRALFLKTADFSCLQSLC